MEEELEVTGLKRTAGEVEDCVVGVVGELRGFSSFVLVEVATRWSIDLAMAVLDFLELTASSDGIHPQIWTTYPSML